MVIFDNSFLGGGKKSELIQESYFTFPKHIREQPLFCSMTFFWGGRFSAKSAANKIPDVCKY